MVGSGSRGRTNGDFDVPFSWMSNSFLRLVAIAAAGLVVAAACAPAQTAESGQAVVSGQAAGSTPVGAGSGQAVGSGQVAASATGGAESGQASAVSGQASAGSVADAPQCAAGNGVATDLPGWPLLGSPDADFMPVVMSTLVTTGPNRFLYNALDASYEQLAAPDVASRVDFYALDRDPTTPVSRTEAVYLSSGEARGLYRAAAEFDCVGEWGAEITLVAADGMTMSERLRFGVGPEDGVTAIGEPAPRSQSLTALTGEDLALITTDASPYPAAYDKTVADTVTSGRPSLVFFATPAFCQTGFCGPTVDLVKSVASDYEGDVEFVNVEPYVLHMAENGLQPLLDADGRLQPVQAALDYGIPVEPYLFLVDADGDVFARFEGVVGDEELRAAIEDVLISPTTAG